MRGLGLLLLVPLVPVSASAAPHQPKAGSPERKAILDALRAPVRRELKRLVTFRVDHLQVERGWAFLTARPQAPGGKALSYRGTPYQLAVDDGVFDNWICALLRREKSGWNVVRYEFGATDVPWDGWDRRYGAPRALFPYRR